MVKIDKIKKLSEEILNEANGLKTEEIYTLINSSKKTKNISNGKLSGLPDELWPINYNKEKTDFQFILNLNDFSFLKKKFPDFEALAYFVESESNDALTAINNPEVYDYDDDYDEEQYNKVVFLTKENYEKCSIKGEFKEVVKFTIPSIVFGNPNNDYFNLDNLSISISKELGEKLKELNKEIYQLPVRIGGNPIWLQENAGISNFIMQFDEGFANINMGDNGIMYLNDYDGFWQCY